MGVLHDLQEILDIGCTENELMQAQRAKGGGWDGRYEEWCTRATDVSKMVRLREIKAYTPSGEAVRSFATFIATIFINIIVDEGFRFNFEFNFD